MDVGQQATTTKPCHYLVAATTPLQRVVHFFLAGDSTENTPIVQPKSESLKIRCPIAVKAGVRFVLVPNAPGSNMAQQISSWQREPWKAGLTSKQ